MVNRTGLERSALPIRDPEILSFIKKIDTNNFFFKSKTHKKFTFNNESRHFWSNSFPL